MSSGYFLVRSNPGGLMIQPCTFAPPLEVYQIASSAPSLMPCSTSAFTFVRRLIGCARRRLNRTTSGGSSGSVRTPTALKSRDTDESDSICSPSVTRRLPPRTPAKYTLLVPCSASAKNTPLPSGPQRTVPGSRSYVVSARSPLPSIPTVHTSSARYEKVPYSCPVNATVRPSGDTTGPVQPPFLVTSGRTAP